VSVECRTTCMESEHSTIEPITSWKTSSKTAIYPSHDSQMEHITAEVKIVSCILLLVGVNIAIERLHFLD